MLKSYSIVLLVGLIAYASSISLADDSDSEEDFDPDRVLTSLDFETKTNLAILLSRDHSRNDMQRILNQALDLVAHRAPSEQTRRQQTYLPQAKALGRAMLGDPTFGSTSEEEFGEAESPGDEYCEPSRPLSNAISVISMKKILELRAANRSHNAIQRLYPKYQRGRLDYYKECVARGEPLTQRIRNLNTAVLKRIAEARERRRAIHGYHIRRWGLEIATEMNISRSFFSASPTWLYKLKKHGRIGSRKITEYISRREDSTQDILDQSIDRFLSMYEDTAGRYPRRLIINMDQTGFNYEYTDKRTLSYIGERDTRVNIDQRNKMTHSFTSQPMVTRDGKLFGKLTLIMQETKNEFGVFIRRKVNEQERQYGNIRVFATTSGKMTTDLYLQWIEEVFQPAIRATITSLDTDTDIGSDFDTLSMDDDAFFEPESHHGDAPVAMPTNRTSANATDRLYRRPHTLFIADSFTGQTGPLARSELARRGIEFLQIPPGATKFIQPLDVWFMRQYKEFISRMFQEADDPRSGIPKSYLTSREGIINAHSLVYNQFGSEAYRNMLRYAWHNTDPHWSVDEMDAPPPPRGVILNQFSFKETKCQHRDPVNNTACSRPAWIKCAHCGKKLCLKHFIERTCFHEVLEQSSGPSGIQSTASHHHHDDEFDDDFDPDLFSRRTSTTPMSRSTTPISRLQTTTPYPHDELRARRSIRA